MSTAPHPGAPVLVVGATGTVGSEVVRQLRAAGVPVRAAVRDPTRAATVLGTEGGDGRGGGDGTGVELARFDVADPATWAATFAGVRRMFLLRPPEHVDVRHGLLPAVDAAVAAGVDTVAFLSVQGAGRNPLLPHRAVERHLQRVGVAWTFLRAGYFMQNLLTVHRAEIRDRSEIFVPAGRGRTAFVDTRDVAAVAVRALTEPGHERRAYELTGAEAPTYAEVAAVLTDVLGRPVRYADPGPVEYVRAQLRRGMPRPFVLLTLALYATARLGLAGHLSPDLARVLGRQPIDLRRFVTDHADAWRHHPAPPAGGVMASTTGTSTTGATTTGATTTGATTTGATTTGTGD